jgi:hypothetical protein
MSLSALPTLVLGAVEFIQLLGSNLCNVLLVVSSLIVLQCIVHVSLMAVDCYIGCSESKTPDMVFLR